VAAVTEAVAAVTKAEGAEREARRATGTEGLWVAAAVEVLGQAQAAKARAVVSAAPTRVVATSLRLAGEVVMAVCSVKVSMA
jgi:hypothetical protein